MPHYLDRAPCACGLGGLSVVIGPDGGGYGVFLLDVRAEEERGGSVGRGFGSWADAEAWARLHRMAVARPRGVVEIETEEAHG